MYISHKSNVLQTVSDTEWNCRRKLKGLTKPEYWTWIDSITDSDGNLDYSGETGYTIVECIDEDVDERLNQLNDYITKEVFNIKYYASKRDAEEILDNDGNSHDPKQYISSHFVGQDDTKDARILAEKWVHIRRQRDRLIAETDWRVIVASESDEGSDLSQTWKNYRTNLRDVPSQADPDNITWPTKPS